MADPCLATTKTPWVTHGLSLGYLSIGYPWAAITLSGDAHGLPMVDL